jgi:hypothetical protein
LKSCEFAEQTARLKEILKINICVVAGMHRAAGKVQWNITRAKLSQKIKIGEAEINFNKLGSYSAAFSLFRFYKLDA